MSNLVIIAIPEESDRVWQVSSEKVPHLTLMFLGEVGKGQDVAQILNFLDHASKTMLHRFYLDVDSRGKLGDDEADVLFFGKSWDLPIIKEFRSALLKNDAIFKANVSEDQFPEWIPHLTLGYPKAPAKKIKDDVGRLYSVSFDRLALWIDDYEGPEFPLKNHEYDEAVAMSAVDEILAVEGDALLHYGVKGMRWGKRKDQSTAPTSVTTTSVTHPKKKTSIKAAGGTANKAHIDAVEARAAVQKLKKSGPNSLSNQELKALSKRLELETKVAKLAGNQTTTKGEKFITGLFDTAEILL